MKKNYINHLAAIVCCVFSLSACSDKALQQDKVDSDMIILPFGDIELHPLGQKVSMPFTCSNNWSVIGETDWLTVTPSSGKAGTTQITIEARPNVGSENRSFTLKFPGKDLVVEQQRTVLSVDKSAFDDAEQQVFVLGWQASERKLNVESNIKWTFRLEDFVDDYEWVQTESDTKEGAEYGQNKVISDKTLKFKMPDNNIGSSVNTASIAVIPLDIDGNELSDQNLANSLTKKIKVKQDFLYFKLISENLNSFDYLGSVYVNSQEEEFKNNHTDCIQTLCVESEADWTIVDETAANDKGIYFSRSEDGKVESVTDKTVKKWNLNIDWRTANPDRDDREYTQKIKVTPEKGKEKELDINLKQLGYVFSVNLLEGTNTQFENNDNDQAITVEIQTDGPWTLENESSWLDPGTDLTGRGDATVKFRTKGQNLNFKDNESTVNFSTAGLNQLQEQRTFSQDRFKFDINLENNANTMRLPRLDLFEHTVNVVSSGPWKVELSDKNYMNCSSYEGEAANTSFYFNFLNTNDDTKDHPVDITVYSTLHEGKLVEGQSKKTFRIVHEPYIFKVQRSESDDSDFKTNTFKAYQAGSQSFYLKCSAPWKIVDYPTWLSVDKSEGDGVSYNTIRITADNNTGKDVWQNPRTGRLTILSDRYGTGIESQMERKTIDISQEEFKFNVTCNASYGGTMLPAIDTQDNSTIQINIESSDNAAWKITGGNWAKTEKTDGKGSMDVKVYSEDNYDLKIRYDVLEVTSVPLGITKSCYIYQDKYVFEPSSITVNEFPELNASSQLITLLCTGNWTIEKPDWLAVTANGKNVTSGSGSKGNANFMLKADNNSGASRSGKFVIKSGGVHVKEYSVSQAAYVWTVTPADDFMGLSEMTGGIKEYTVESSGSWEATSSNSAHVHVSASNTGGGRGVAGVVTVTVDPNYTTSKIDATVTVKSTAFPSKVYKQIKISQNAYKWSVGDPDVSTFNADGATNNTAKVSIKECSGSWKADSSAGWLKLDKAEGNGGDTIVVTVKDANTDTADRKATLTITSKENSALKKVIEFIQKGTPPKEE